MVVLRLRVERAAAVLVHLEMQVLRVLLEQLTLAAAAVVVRVQTARVARVVPVLSSLAILALSNL